MTKEEKEVVDRFMVSLADYANKIDYVAEQAEITEEVAPEAIGIIRDYTNKIMNLADRFNKWIESEEENAKKLD